MRRSQPHAHPSRQHAAGDYPEGGRRDLPQIDLDPGAVVFEPSANCSRDQAAHRSASTAAEIASVEIAVAVCLKMPSTCLK
jgi:hypothetical protein